MTGLSNLEYRFTFGQLAQESYDCDKHEVIKTGIQEWHEHKLIEVSFLIIFPAVFRGKTTTEKTVNVGKIGVRERDETGHRTGNK